MVYFQNLFSLTILKLKYKKYFKDQISNMNLKIIMWILVLKFNKLKISSSIMLMKWKIIILEKYFTTNHSIQFI